MKEKGFLIYYALFVVTSFSAGLLGSTLLPLHFFHIQPPKLGGSFFWLIVENNTKNFLSYLFLFPLSPILQLIDLLLLGFQIGISTQKIGIFITISGLFPHGLLEIPNLLFYQGLSQFILYKCWVERSKTRWIQRETYFLKWYLLSYISLLLAAFLEGFIG